MMDKFKWFANVIGLLGTVLIPIGFLVLIWVGFVGVKILISGIILAATFSVLAEALD